MPRVHVTAADLARTRIADGPDSLGETVLSVHQLTERSPGPALRAWRTRECTRGRSALRMLRPVMPPRGYFPDFLTPAASLGGLESGIDAVLSTPRSRLRAEGARLVAGLVIADGALGVSAGAAMAEDDDRDHSFPAQETDRQVAPPGTDGP